MNNSILPSFVRKLLGICEIGLKYCKYLKNNVVKHEAFQKLFKLQRDSFTQPLSL